MRVSEYSVGHHRTGWHLYLSHTSLTRLALTHLLGMVPAFLVNRYVWLYRPWSWAICKLDGTAVGQVPLNPVEAQVLSPDFYREMLELHGDDLEADGSLKKELWK